MKRGILAENSGRYIWKWSNRNDIEKVRVYGQNK